MESGSGPGFGEVCTRCGKDLHVCLNCAFHAPGRRWDCAETIDAPVVDKDRRNLCDWYRTSPVRLVAGAGRQSERDKAASSGDAFRKLFGG